MAQRVGGEAAAILALTLAINPAYTAMTVFDNNALAAMMAGFGLACAALARYLRRETLTNAFLFGLAIGFAIWARANFVWIVVAGGVAALLVFRSRLLVPAKNWIAMCCGGIVGGSPFLIYQLESGAGTWKAQSLLEASRPLIDSIRYRIPMLQEMLLSDGEHRRMWGGGPLPKWELWFLPVVLGIACVVCVILRARNDRPRLADAQFVVLTLLFLASYMLLTRIEVAEHHLIALLPFAATVVVLACSILHSRYGTAWIISLSVALLYAGLAVYWQLAAIQGLRSSGGIGMWSGSVFELARHLDQEYQGREVKILDWGLQANLFVLTDSRFKSAELYVSGSEDTSRQNRSWKEEISKGGIFLLNGPEAHEDPKPSLGFLRALAETRPIVSRRYSVPQRNGAAYAEIIEIEPDSVQEGVTGVNLGSTLSMGDASVSKQLSGFYQIENGSWRWTSRTFAVIMATPHATNQHAELLVQLSIPDALIQKLGAITLSARLGDHLLPTETYAKAGDFAFRRDLPTAWLAPPTVRIDFSLDKALPPSSADGRELGIVVRTVAINTK